MIKIYTKILLSFIILSILISSCSKEEYNITSEPNPSGLDTIIIDDRVVLSTDGGTVELSGFYTQCDNQVNINERPEFTHIIAYADSLEIINGIGTWSGPLNVLYWTSSKDLEEGNYLVEGIYLDPDNSIEEESLLYNLTISEVTSFSVKGYFNTVQNSISNRSGEFETRRYSCQELEIDGQETAEELVEYADGRMSLSINSEEEKVLMSAASYCENIFTDKPGLTKIIFGGGAFYLDPVLGEIDYDEIPELLILFDMDVVGAIENGESFKGYYLDDLEAIFNSPDDPTYDELITMGSSISVTITSETDNYVEGTYIGILEDGRKVSGNFRANIITSC